MTRKAAFIEMLKDVKRAVDALIEEIETGGLPYGEYSGEGPVDPDPEVPSDPEPEPAPDPDPAPVPAPVPNPPGTAVKTDAELVTAINNASAGDVIDFAGDFGMHTFRGINPAADITLRGHGATMERLTLMSCSRIAIEGVKFVGRTVAPDSGAKPYLLKGDRNTNHISVAGCDFWGAPDADQFRTWDISRWRAFEWSAAMFEGDDIALADLATLGTNFGINVTGRRVNMQDIRVCGFSGDSFRLCAHNLRANGLWSTDAYVISGNHPDGIQGFDNKSTLSDQVIEDVIIMEYSTPTDQRNGFGASLQLLGYHNKPYDGITLRRIVGACSSLNAYHVNGDPNHVGDKIMLWSVPGPKGGVTKLRVTSALQLTDVYVDKVVSGTATGKPDYSKLDAFRVAALRGAVRPDIDQIIGW